MTGRGGEGWTRPACGHSLDRSPMHNTPSIGSRPWGCSQARR